MLRYQNNAFRILGLKPNVSMKEIVHRVNEIKVKKSLGMDVVYDYDFMWMGPLDRSEQSVINALQHLENPITRLREEMFWFWFDTDCDKQAIDYLVKNNRQVAHNTWKTLVAPENLNRKSISAFINQTILAHSSVIGKEIKLRYREEAGEHRIVIGKESDSLYCPKCRRRYGNTWEVCLYCSVRLESAPKERTVRRKRRDTNFTETHWKNWRFVINRLTSIASERIFWAIVKEKAERINDPRLSTAKVDEIRDNLLEDMAEANFTFISQALISKDYERIKQHSGLLNGSSLTSDVLRKGFNRVLVPQIDLLNRHSQNASNELLKVKKEPKNLNKAILDLYFKLVDNTTDIIYEGNLVDINSVSDFTLAKDSLATVVRESAVILHNVFAEDYSIPKKEREVGHSQAYEMIKKALEFAGSTYIKQKYEKDEEILKNSLEMARSYSDYYQQTSHAPEDEEIVEDVIEQTSHTVSSSKFNWKSLLIWGGIILFFIIIGNLPDNSSNNKTSLMETYYSPKSTISNSNQLRTNIENLAYSIKRKEIRLLELKKTLQSEETKLENIEQEIDDLKSTIESDRFGKDKIAEEYDAKITEYNRRFSIYNNIYAEYQSLYDEHQSDIKTHNSLVESYNAKAR